MGGGFYGTLHRAHFAPLIQKEYSVFCKIVHKCCSGGIFRPSKSSFDVHKELEKIISKSDLSGIVT